MSTKDGKKWQRVVGTGMTKWQKAREDANKSTMKNEIFIKSCEMAGVDVTKRQASKYNNKKGIAFKQGKQE